MLNEERLSPEAEARLRGLIDNPKPGRRRLPLVLAPVAAAALALLIWIVMPGSGERAKQKPTLVGGFELAHGKVRESAPGQVSCGSPRCQLRAAGMGVRLELTRGAVAAHGEQELRLLRGKTTFSVQPVKEGGAPVRVRVSHGVIEVLGTRFTIWQDRGRGRVLLQEGAIQFRAQGGRVIKLSPGQELRWPLVPGPASTSTSTSTSTSKSKSTSTARSTASSSRKPGRAPAKKAKPPPPPFDTGALVERVERLRLQGRYGEAARALSLALPRISDRVMRERLSFELGAILSDQLQDRAAACRHWERHLRAHGRARYGAQIAAARARLGCGASRE